MTTKKPRLAEIRAAFQRARGVDEAGEIEELKRLLAKHGKKFVGVEA